jgi:hypothetical protein
VKELERYISPLIEQQFPSFYREEGPRFIAFVKAYYEYLESTNNVLYHARRIPEYQDVDSTLEDFIVHFKEKYLRNIQFDTTSNKRLFIKNALNFYRAKGTERAVDLFFKLIYGVDAEVYYPGDDLFKLSDGEWIIPTYLEISPSPNSNSFIGKVIEGTLSGATAFVDDLVKRKAKGLYIDVFYLSNIKGDFRTGELLKLKDSSDLDDNPYVVGSLTTVDVDSGGESFDVGSAVHFISNSGAFGKALVTSTVDVDGVVTFTLEDGGYGYNSNSQVLISNTILRVSSQTGEHYNIFDTVSQNIANIAFENANNSFAANDVVTRYYANNDPAGSGLIISVTQSGANGTMLVAVQSGNLQAGTANLYNQANAIWANNLTYTDKTATGNVIGVSANLVLLANSYTGSFQIGERIYQANNTATEWANATVSSVTTDGINITINTTNAHGDFKSGYSITGETTGYTADFISFTNKIGLINVVNTFYAVNNYVIGSISGNGKIVSISTGNGAVFTLGANSTLSNTETINVNSDYITTNGTHYTPVNLNAVAYGFPGSPTANLTSNSTSGNAVLSGILTYGSKTIGRLTTSSIIGVNPGSEYSEPPFVLIFEPMTYQFGLRDYYISYTDQTSEFEINEVVKQSNSSGGLVTNGAIGLVHSTSNNIMDARRLSVSNTFTTANASESYIKGMSSGTIARMLYAIPNYDTPYIGLNANISTESVTSNGSVTELEVINSGFGYKEGETVTFYNADDSSMIGTATLHLGKQGIGSGYYRTSGGFLSANKYLYDGDYYQEYSYDIKTAIPFEEYSDMFKKVLHVAGTKAFGTYVSVENAANTLTISVTDGAIEILEANGAGTVSSNTTMSNIVGTGTSFTTDYSNGDIIAIFNSSTEYSKKTIVEVVNNTIMIVTGPNYFTNTSSNYARVSYDT